MRAPARRRFFAATPLPERLGVMVFAAVVFGFSLACALYIWPSTPWHRAVMLGFITIVAAEVALLFASVLADRGGKS